MGMISSPIASYAFKDITIIIDEEGSYSC